MYLQIQPFFDAEFSQLWYFTSLSDVADPAKTAFFLHDYLPLGIIASLPRKEDLLGMIEFGIDTKERTIEGGLFYPFGAQLEGFEASLVGRGLGTQVMRYVATDLRERYPGDWSIVVAEVSPRLERRLRKQGLEPERTYQLERYTQCLL